MKKGNIIKLVSPGGTYKVRITEIAPDGISGFYAIRSWMQYTMIEGGAGFFPWPSITSIKVIK